MSHPGTEFQLKFVRHQGSKQTKQITDTHSVKTQFGGNMVAVTNMQIKLQAIKHFYAPRYKSAPTAECENMQEAVS